MSRLWGNGIDERGEIAQHPTTLAEARRLGELLATGPRPTSGKSKRMLPIKGQRPKEGNSTMTKTHDVVIIGGGPAALAAGIYAGRAELRTLIIERQWLGGQIALTHSVENYPGFPDASGDKVSLHTQKARDRS